jgi:hypothetical protein
MREVSLLTPALSKFIASFLAAAHVVYLDYFSDHGMKLLSPSDPSSITCQVLPSARARFAYRLSDVGDRSKVSEFSTQCCALIRDDHEPAKDGQSARR